jgi:hypothetical protein
MLIRLLIPGTTKYLRVFISTRMMKGGFKLTFQTTFNSFDFDFDFDFDFLPPSPEGAKYE